jgi:hypothetical protein
LCQFGSCVSGLGQYLFWTAATELFKKKTPKWYNLNAQKVAGVFRVNESNQVFVIIVIIILLLVLAFFGTSYLSKRAIKSVIKSLRDNQALSPATARLPEELGLERKGALQLRSLRDYKPAAIQLLQQHEIIQNTGEGKIYLSEEKLLQSGFENRLYGRGGSR